MSFTTALTVMACCVAGSAMVSGIALVAAEWRERRERAARIAAEPRDAGGSDDWRGRRPSVRCSEADELLAELRPRGAVRVRSEGRA
ncbi:hypothetical protein [Actinopolyspora xinjiangensis]|uniref:hypothetical protein n=1 Tax=Actinopolyspora xinjiangensis TaxID=405564 RepID=UPI001B8AFCF0|nr:hypothetical protein [Actinopolyspora xinjiangensis]